MDEIIPRKRKTKKIAEIKPWCTGCGSSPVCMIYCKQNALVLMKDSEHYPFSIMTVDDKACIGCTACVSKGENGIVLTGCPWNAIRMVSVS